MAEAYLISTVGVKEFGYLTDNVRDSLLNVIIRRVQDTVIQPIIGTTLFKRLLEGIDNDDLNADETELLNDYIAPCIAAACDRKSINALTYELRSESAAKAQDPHLTPVSETENLKFTDDITKDVYHYRRQLIGFLKDNEDKFPQYKDYECNEEDIKPDQGKTRTNIQFV